jgi:FPC/CPF motif-containing protein YcgG
MTTDLMSRVEEPSCDTAPSRKATYSYLKDDFLLTRDGDRERPAEAKAAYFHSQLQAMIEAKPYVCAGAKAALHRKTYRMGLYGALGDAESTRHLHEDLCTYVAERLSMPGPFRSFVAVFEGPYYADERGFENALWNQLQLLHELDAATYEWDPTTSSDPTSDHFSFSIAGTSFFLVGMHPASSRLARKFIVPAIAFNAHDQFEELRANGLYSRVAASNRERDIALQGSINPNLADHGHGKEATQYSGRRVERDWVCPFQAASK